MTYWKHPLCIFIFLFIAAASYWFYYVKEPFSNTRTMTTKKYTANAKEGFNMIDREGTMLRGKQSNQIPVLSTDSNYDNLEAGDKYVFSGNYTAA